jgi:hypothetical protein
MVLEHLNPKLGALTFLHYLNNTSDRKSYVTSPSFKDAPTAWPEQLTPWVDRTLLSLW